MLPKETDTQAVTVSVSATQPALAASAVQDCQRYAAVKGLLPLAGRLLTRLTDNMVPCTGKPAPEAAPILPWPLLQPGRQPPYDKVPQKLVRQADD